VVLQNQIAFGCEKIARKVKNFIMNKSADWLWGAGAASCFVALTQLVTASLNELNNWHRIALVCFGICLPTFAAAAIDLNVPEPPDGSPVRRGLRKVGPPLVVVFGFGITALFFSFGCWIGASWIAGVLYLLILFGFGIHARRNQKPAAAQPSHGDHGYPPSD